MRAGWQVYGRLGLILAVFLVFSLAHSFWLPLHEAPDEIAHFQYARFIARTGRLPLTTEERVEAGYLSFWPPLYHAIAALATGWSDSSGPPHLKFVWESPRFELASRLLDTKRLANTEDELWPFQGMVLMWHLGRVVSIILSMGTIGVAFLTSLEIFPGNYRLALLCAALLAFVPAFIFISAAMSYEALVGLLIGLYFWMLVKIVKGKLRSGSFIWLGVFLGLAVTAKYTAVILPIQVVVVLAFLARRHHWGWLNWFKRMSWVALAAIAASGWWFLFLIVYFNEIAKLGPVVGSLKPIIAGGIDTSQNYSAYLLTGGQIGSITSGEIVPDSWGDWLGQMFQSFWVTQIGDYPLGLPAQLFIGAVFLAALLGLARAWSSKSETRVWIILLISQVALFLVFPLLRFVIQGKVSWTAQGRHVLFPVATVLPLLLIYGSQVWPSPKMRRWFTLAVVGGLVCWSMAQLIRMTTFYPPLLPVRSTPERIKEIPHPLNQLFGDGLILRGYDWQIIPAAGAFKVSLYWQSSTYPDEDYLLAVRLVQNGRPRLNWLAYPVNGRYPTRVWENWELIRDDLVLPLLDLPPGSYQVQVQLRGAAGPLPVAQTDYLTVAEVTLPKASGLKPQVRLPVVVEGREVVSGFTLWQADQYREVRLPKYRPRMAISLVWQGRPVEGERVQWLLVDPQDAVYASQSASPHFEYFLVKPDWPSGDYRLRAEVWRGDTVAASQETGPVVEIFNETPRRLQPPAITRPFVANFADQVQLLGYDLPHRALSPGQGVPLTLYWQGLRTMGQSYTIFTKLLDQQHQVWGQAERLPADGYKTTYWLENEVVVDSFELPVKPNIPNGVYWLNVGLYQEVNHTAVSLPLIHEGQPAEVTSVTFGPLKAGGPPPGIVLSPQEVNPAVSLSIDLGNPPVIRLRGYDLGRTNDDLELTLYWESLAQTGTDWNIFVHLRNKANQTVAQKDGPAGSGLYPSSLWSPGETIADKLVLSADHLPDQDYDLVIGLYNFTTGRRLAIPNTSTNEILLTHVTALDN